MASVHDESGDDTASSLGESSYDFIEDRSNATTDDEDQDAMTESTTSSDGNTFEQIHPPMQGHEQSDHVEQHSQGESAVSPHILPKTSRFHNVPSSQSPDQGYPDLDFEHQPDPIEFEEPSITNLNSSRFTEVSHTLNLIEKHASANQFYGNLLDRLHGHLAISVRQTMTSQSLNPRDGKYKILYIGDAQIRESIIQKVGTALAATLATSPQEPETPRSSKFNIIPISAFEGETSPEVVLIDSSGLELTVEDCQYASFTRKQSGHDSIRLALFGDNIVESSWTGSSFSISDDWRLPDVAIFFLPDDDNFGLRTTRQFARTFMSRHKVPSITISQSPTWDTALTESISLDYLTPHICLESRKSSLVHAQIIRRYPIDLQTFLNIDAGQMNRNLACLSATPKISKPKKDNDATAEDVRSVSANLRELVKSFIADLQTEGFSSLVQSEHIARFAFILISLLGMVAVGLGFLGLLSASRVSTSKVFPIDASLTSTPDVSTLTKSEVALLTSNAIAPISESTSSIPVQLATTKSTSTNTDLASFLLDAYTLAPNKSDHFKVHVLGDCHVVLKPPQWFTKAKKTPTLFFKVQRSNLDLQHQKTTLFDGVYALQVPREDAYGMVNVSVWTESKPLVNENFEVDFGSSWLKVAGWKKAISVMSDSIRGDLNSVQTGLSTVFDHTKTSLSTFVQQRNKSVTAQQPTDRATPWFHLETASKTKDVVVTQTKDLQRALSSHLYTFAVTASVRFSSGAEGLSRDLVIFIRNETSLLSQQARHLSGAATGANVRALVGGVGDFRQKYLRETQKRALKAWWNLRGVPQQRSIIVKAKDCSPTQQPT
ncbi:hypothetical protein ACLMJK_000698 [Lecanora helva]